MNSIVHEHQPTPFCILNPLPLSQSYLPLYTSLHISILYMHLLTTVIPHPSRYLCYPKRLVVCTFALHLFHASCFCPHFIYIILYETNSPISFFTLTRVGGSNKTF